MNQKLLLRVVVASPGDVKAERDLLPGVIDEINRGIAAELGVYLELTRWETDAFPSFHSEGPQGAIDSVLNIEDCDILLGIFWKRFGTPTNDSLSGTEHEFRLAYDSWKTKGRPQIMVYFSETPANPKSKADLEQLGRVLDFKDHFPKEGLWWSYRRKSEFSNLIRKHLTLFLRSRSTNKPLPAAADDLSTFFAEYRKRLSGLYARWDLSPVGVTQGGGANQPIDVKLEDMYLPLRLSAGYDVSEVSQGTAYSHLALLARDRPVVIRGIAGSGKTTWVRWMFRALLRDKDAFPIAVELRRLAAAWVKTSNPGVQHSLDHYLKDWVSEYVGVSWAEKLSAALANEQGPRPVLLVDGWDELGPLGEDLRSKIVGLITSHPRVLAVVTSRPYGQGRPSHSDGFDVLDIQPLSNPEINAFARNFFGKCYGEDESAVGQNAARFMNALDRSSEATSLARTALLLTMMLLISRSSPLPDKRHLLYQKCVENLLTALPDRRQEEGVLLTSEQWRPEDSEERLRTIATMAFRMQDFGYEKHGRGTIIFNWHDAKSQLPGAWRDEQKDKFLRWLTGPAGMLIDNADGTLAFTHLSFQEYLVAWYLHTTVEGDGARREVCSTRLDDISWWETLRLWAAIVGGQHPAKWLPVISELLTTELGICLAGAMIADGLGNEESFSEWLTLFVDLIRRPTSLAAEEMNRAWTASRQEDRKRAIAEKLNELATSSGWLEWMRFREWMRTIRLQATINLPAAGSNARALIDGLYVPIKAPEQVALGRILCSGSPLWPGDPEHLVFLQLWPSRRRVIGHFLQSLVSLGATRAQLFRAAKVSIERVHRPRPYSRMLETTGSNHRFSEGTMSDFLDYWGGTWAWALDRFSGFEFDLGQDWAADWLSQCIFDWAPRATDDRMSWWEDVLDPKHFGRLRSRDCADNWVRCVARLRVPEPDRIVTLDGEGGDVLKEFPDIQVLALPRMGIRTLLAHAEPTRQPSVLKLIILACRLSLQPRGDSRVFRRATSAYPESADPLWLALARHIARRSTLGDRQLLIELAQSPENREGHVCWGLKYIVRGDIRIDENSEITLDNLTHELQLPPLPYIDEMSLEPTLSDES